MILTVTLRPRIRIILALVALGACTPIAPSFYKATRGGNLGGGPTVPEAPGSTVATVQILVFDSRVEDPTTYLNSLGSVTSPAVQIHFSPESNSAAFQQFRSQGSLVVPVGSVLPEEVTAHLKLDLSDFEIHQLGLQEVKTLLKPTSDPSNGQGLQWVLAIREGTDPDLSHTLLEHLEAITVVIKPSGATLVPHVAPSVTPAQ